MKTVTCRTKNTDKIPKKKKNKEKSTQMNIIIKLLKIVDTNKS